MLQQFRFEDEHKHIAHTLIWIILKGHGNKADFLGFLKKLGTHRSLTLPFEPFRFWPRIRGDIRNRKTTPRLAESGSRWLSDSASLGVDNSPTHRVGESAFECLKEKLGESESRRLPNSANRESLTPRLGESESHQLPDSPSRGVAMVSRGVGIRIFLNLASIFRTLNG